MRFALLTASYVNYWIAFASVSGTTVKVRATR